MAYVGIDTQGARALGTVLKDAAARADSARQDIVTALSLADLASQAPLRLGHVHDGLSILGTSVVDKAELAERFVASPEPTSASLGTTVDGLGTAISGLIGFALPTDLRAMLTGLAPPGVDPALDAALGRLDGVLRPALLAGQRPEVPAELLDDLRTLALRLGIENAGPPVLPVIMETVRVFVFQRRQVAPPRTGTEVFWNDFWADGRSVADVLADPQRLLDWVAGTVQQDRRLAVATALPQLGDVLASFDFATKGSGPEEVDALIAEAQAQFAAIGDWLPAYLVGRDSTGPDPLQLQQTLAFATRVGWTDPGAAAGDEGRFAAAIAYLRANRMLQSALLPPGFEGDPAPVAFFNDAGIGLVLELGRNAGVVNETYLGGVAGLRDRLLTGLGLDPAAAAPLELTQQLQQGLFALAASQIPRAMAESPAMQAQFVASLGYLRQATTGAEQRQRILNVVAAFRTLAVTGAPALTERQLVDVVGRDALGVLGRSRLRLRSEGAVGKNPEFLLLARQWGIPGSRKQDIGKHKFGFTFDELGVLTSISRKKKKEKGFFSKIVDTIKSVGKAIWDSFEDNPLKGIFQIGKIALGVAALVVPGFQGLGVAALAVNLAETAFHALEGDWLSAIGAGLSALTAGADIFGTATGVVQAAQASVLGDLFGSGTLGVLQDAKRAFDIGTAVFRATQADSLVDIVGAGLGAVSTALGSGGQLLANLGAIDPDFARDLVALGTTVRDVTRLVAPAAGLIQALDTGNLLAAFGHGLSVVSAGAVALINPRGAFTDSIDAPATLFGFDKETRDTLRSLAQGTGVIGAVTRAIAAADNGDAFLAGSLLAEALRVVNNPASPVPGDRVEIAKRIAEVSVVLEAVFKGANPAAAAPLVVDRLTRLTDFLAPPPRPVPPLPERAPGLTVVDAPGQVLLSGAAPAGASTAAAGAFLVEDVGEDAGTVFEAQTLAASAGSDTLGGGAGSDTLLGAAGSDTLIGGVGGDLLLAQADAGTVPPFQPPPAPGQNGTSFDLQPGEHYLQLGDEMMVDGVMRRLDREETIEVAPGVIIHVVPPEKLPVSEFDDGLVRVAANHLDPATGAMIVSDASMPFGGRIEAGGPDPGVAPGSRAEEAEQADWINSIWLRGTEGTPTAELGVTVDPKFGELDPDVPGLVTSSSAIQGTPFAAEARAEFARLWAAEHEGINFIEWHPFRGLFGSSPFADPEAGFTADPTGETATPGTWLASGADPDLFGAEPDSGFPYPPTEAELAAAAPPGTLLGTTPSIETGFETPNQFAVDPGDAGGPPSIAELDSMAPPGVSVGTDFAGSPYADTWGLPTGTGSDDLPEWTDQSWNDTFHLGLDADAAASLDAWTAELGASIADGAAPAYDPGSWDVPDGVSLDFDADADVEMVDFGDW